MSGNALNFLWVLPLHHKAFQKYCGLELNGVVDGKTWDKLLDRY